MHFPITLYAYEHPNHYLSSLFKPIFWPNIEGKVEEALILDPTDLQRKADNKYHLLAEEGNSPVGYQSEVLSKDPDQEWRDPSPVLHCIIDSSHEKVDMQYNHEGQYNQEQCLHTIHYSRNTSLTDSLMSEETPEYQDEHTHKH